MPIVFACAASHAPGMTAWTEAAPKEQADNFLGNYRQLGAMLAAAHPDVIVAFRSSIGQIFSSTDADLSASAAPNITTARSKSGCAFPKLACPATRNSPWN